MNTCSQCAYYVAVEDTEPAQGQCRGLPPTVMLLPVAPPENVARIGPRQMGAQLQAISPIVVSDFPACSLFKPASLN